MQSFNHHKSCFYCIIMKLGVIFLLIILSISNTSAEAQDFSYTEYKEHIIELYNSGKDTKIHNIVLDISVEILNGYIIEIEFQDFDAITIKKINEIGNYNYTHIAGSVRMRIIPPNLDNNYTDPCGLGPCLVSGTYNLIDQGLHTNYATIPFYMSSVFIAIIFINLFSRHLGIPGNKLPKF